MDQKRWRIASTAAVLALTGAAVGPIALVATPAGATVQAADANDSASNSVSNSDSASESSSVSNSMSASTSDANSASPSDSVSISDDND